MVRPGSKAAGNRRAKDMDLHIQDMMSNKEECAELINLHFKIHPLLVFFACLLFIINVIFVAIAIQQYQNLVSATNKIGDGIRIAKNAFEIGRSYTELLMDSNYLAEINK